MKKVSSNELVVLGDREFKRKKYTEAARYYQAASHQSEDVFYLLFMEVVCHYLSRNLSLFKKRYRLLLEMFQDNQFIRELICFISLKSDPLDQVLNNWIDALLDYPHSKKIRQAIKKVKRSKDPLLLKRHSQLLHFVSLPNKKIRAELNSQATESTKATSALDAWFLSTKRNALRSLFSLYYFLRKAIFIIIILGFIFFIVKTLQITIDNDWSAAYQYWRTVLHPGNLLPRQRLVLPVDFAKQDKDSDLVPSEDFVAKDETSSGAAANNQGELLRQNHNRLLLEKTPIKAQEQESQRKQKFDQDQVSQRITVAKRLLREGKRNDSLMLINEILVNDYPAQQATNLQIIKDIARSYQSEGDPTLLTLGQILADEYRYDQCSVHWKGRLEQIHHLAEGDYLRVAYRGIQSGNVGKDSENLIGYFYFFWPERIGNINIGKELALRGRIQAQWKHSEFKNTSFFIRGDQLFLLEPEAE